MRQVNRDEFAYAIACALRKVTATMRKEFATGTPTKQTKARAMIAIGVAEELKRYEILTNSPDLELGDETCSKPLRNMLGDGRL